MTPSSSKMAAVFHDGPSRTCATILKPLALRDEHSQAPTLFLGGTIASNVQPDWRDRLSMALAECPVTIFNPKNPAWDSTWREDSSDGRWKAQNMWETSTRTLADVVVFYFEAGTDAPVTLLELGLTIARQDKRQTLVVYAARDYSKRGYVEETCRAFQVAVHDAENAFIRAVKEAVVQASGQEIVEL